MFSPPVCGKRKCSNSNLWTKLDKVKLKMVDESPDGSSAPSAFTSHATTAEELLKTQTVGLVSLSDYRKRHAEAKEAKEREAEARIQSGFTTSRSGSATPNDGYVPANSPARYGTDLRSTA